MPRRAKFCSVVLLSILGAGCTTLGYLGHTARGGLTLVAGRRSIDSLLDDPAVSGTTKDRLELILEIRRFASRVVLLPDNRSYRLYKHLDRPFATWLVTAAEEFSLTLVEWCFPVTGCVSYRGYFSSDKAAGFAARLQRNGLETDIGGVLGYSTLGWFADPVLSTFLDLRESELVGLIHHELAHQQLYVRGDTLFNESFATAVEIEGVRRWFDMHGDSEASAAYSRERCRERAFLELVAKTRQRLAKIYAESGPVEWKRERKAFEFDQLRQDYARLQSIWGEPGSWDAWLGSGLNNARLGALGIYSVAVGGFREILEQCGDSLACFYSETRELARLSPEDRAAELERLTDRHSALHDECASPP